MTLRQIEDMAMKLSPAERKQLAARLIDSVDEAEATDIERAWLHEAIRRREELDRNPALGISAKQFHDELNKEFGWS